MDLPYVFILIYVYLFLDISLRLFQICPNWSGFTGDQNEETRSLRRLENWLKWLWFSVILPESSGDPTGSIPCLCSMFRSVIVEVIMIPMLLHLNSFNNLNTLAVAKGLDVVRLDLLSKDEGSFVCFFFEGVSYVGNGGKLPWYRNRCYVR